MSDLRQPPWFLAQIQPNQLRIAVTNLARQGFEAFCPKRSETRRRAGRFVEVEAPLFPGYLFVAFDPETSPWRVINNTRGISRLVSFGEATPPVPDALIKALKARCDASGTMIPDSSFEAGEPVQIVSGPFADFAAKVEAIAPQQRVWVLLDIMGRETRVALEGDKLRRP